MSCSRRNSNGISVGGGINSSSDTPVSYFSHSLHTNKMQYNVVNFSVSIVGGTQKFKSM